MVKVGGIRSIEPVVAPFRHAAISYATPEKLRIPRVIYQTYKSRSLPWIARFYRAWIRCRSPGYRLELFDDGAIEAFLREAYPSNYLAAFKKLQVGAGKADFFRYAILYERGGIYLDLDAMIHVSLDRLIHDEDEALISHEAHHDPSSGKPLFLQWALMFSPGHPILREALERMIDNIVHERFPHDLHRATGPTLFTQAVRSCLDGPEDVPHRIIGTDYEGQLSCAWWLGRRLKARMYRKDDEWAERQRRRSIYEK